MNKAEAAVKVIMDAYRACKPYDAKGRLISESEWLAGKVLTSAASYQVRGKSRDHGSVKRLLAHMERAC